MSIVTDLRVLIVEDDGPKLNAIIHCLSEEVGIRAVKSARSLTSAIYQLEQERYDLCVIDMSIPTYDFDADKTGGEPQASGGIDVLRYIQSEAHGTKAIIVTQYSEFPDGNGVASTLEDVTRKLFRKFGCTLLAVLFYASQKSDWRHKLKLSISGEFDGY